MKFNVVLELVIKDKCEKPLVSKLQAELNSPSNGTNYFVEEALREQEDMTSIMGLLNALFGVYGIFYVRWGDTITASGTFEASEAYEFNSLRAFESISQYLDNGSRLVINGKGLEIAGGKVDFI